MRIALGIEYDGTDFHGWQRQRTGRTVQGCLEEALSRVADHELATVCAGRTDTGVHATEQVIHIDTGAVREENAWIRGGNANLPADIRIQWAREVDDTFHARFSARRRHYRYVILNRPYPSAQFRHRASWIYAGLDEAAMRRPPSICSANMTLPRFVPLHVRQNTRSGQFIHSMSIVAVISSISM